MGIIVKRGGITSPYWSGNGSKVSIQHGGPHLTMSFSIASKGGGTTSIQVQVDPESFADITVMMAKVNREKALQAFARAMVIKP